MKPTSALTLFLPIFATFTSALPPVARKTPLGNALLRTIYQFPNETWVENLAVRANGKILVTLVTTPEVWEVDPFASTAELIYHFPDALSVTGIQEWAPDNFAVNVGNFSIEKDEAIAGSYSVWNIDMCETGSKHRDHARVKKITDIPQAKFLNGMTNLPASPSTLLLADSGGFVWRMNARTGTYSIAIDNRALKPNESVALKLGVNGIHVRPSEPDSLYFSTSFSPIVWGRILINAHTGAQTAHVETIVARSQHPPDLYTGANDDFAFDSKGNIWGDDAPTDDLVKVSVPGGEVEIIAEAPQLIGNTACNFGRTKGDVEKGTLYITTNGGIAFPPPGGIVGGKVMALDTADL